MRGRPALLRLGLGVLGLALLGLALLGGRPVSAAPAWITVTSIAALRDAAREAAPGARLQLRGSHDPAAPRTFDDAYLELVDVRGTPEQPIRIRVEPGTFARITTPAALPYRPALVRLRTCAHVHLSGLWIEDHQAPDLASDAVGLSIEVSAAKATLGVELTALRIRGIRAFYDEGDDSTPPRTSNAHAILARSAHEHAPIEGLTIRGCYVGDLALGSSEAISLDGNVRRFLVAGNVVERCDNIGIDLIGGYHRPGAPWDRARDGRVVGNIVRACSSLDNPAYGGVPAAGGIYVDGGQRIEIEGNRVLGCDHGIEVGCERRGHRCVEILLRDNHIEGSIAAALVLGSNGRDFDPTKEVQPQQPSTGEVVGIRIRGTTLATGPDAPSGSLIELLRVRDVRFEDCLFLLRRAEDALLGQHLVDGPCHDVSIDGTNRLRSPHAEGTVVPVRLSRDSRLSGHTLPPAPDEQTWGGLRRWGRDTGRPLRWRLARLETSTE